MKPTHSFEKYVDPIFIIQNGLQRYVKTCKDNSYLPFMKLDDYIAEEYVRFGMCVNIIKQIESLIDFDTQKNIYSKSIKDLTNQDLTYSEFYSKKEKLDNTLMTIAKFEYCKNKYKKENYIRNDLIVLGYLSAILIKLREKHNKLNPSHVNHIFSKTKLYKYIKETNLEEEDLDIRVFNKLSLLELIEVLYNNIINYDYEHENKTVEPALAIEHNTDDINDLGHYVQDYYHVHIDTLDNTFGNYKEQKDKEIYDWLIDQMHIIEEGRTF